LFRGFNTFGQNQNLAVSTQQPSGPPPFTKATKFNDLPDDVKKILETIEYATLYFNLWPDIDPIIAAHSFKAGLRLAKNSNNGN